MDGRSRLVREDNTSHRPLPACGDQLCGSQSLWYGGYQLLPATPGWVTHSSLPGLLYWLCNPLYYLCHVQPVVWLSQPPCFVTVTPTPPCDCHTPSCVCHTLPCECHTLPCDCHIQSVPTVSHIVLFARVSPNLRCKCPIQPSLSVSHPAFLINVTSSLPWECHTHPVPVQAAHCRLSLEVISLFCLIGTPLLTRIPMDVDQKVNSVMAQASSMLQQTATPLSILPRPTESVSLPITDPPANHSDVITTDPAPKIIRRVTTSSTVPTKGQKAELTNGSLSPVDTPVIDTSVLVLPPNIGQPSTPIKESNSLIGTETTVSKLATDPPKSPTDVQESPSIVPEPADAFAEPSKSVPESYVSESTAEVPGSTTSFPKPRVDPSPVNITYNNQSELSQQGVTDLLNDTAADVLADIPAADATDPAITDSTSDSLLDSPPAEDSLPPVPLSEGGVAEPPAATEPPADISETKLSVKVPTSSEPKRTYGRQVSI